MNDRSPRLPAIYNSRVREHNENVGLPSPLSFVAGESTGGIGDEMADRFVQLLMFEGRLCVGAAPAWELSDEGLDSLKLALAIQSLHLPGPRLEGSLDVAIQAVHVVYRFAWRFLKPQPTPVANDPTLCMERGPATAAEHVAGDLAFCFLPGLLQRIVGRNPQDELAAPLKHLLRQWPLSGVLADISEAPLVPIEFGHPGVGYRYAERLAKRERRGWVPTGADYERAEVVYDVLGRPMIEPLLPEEVHEP